ncbi:MAG: hypothetical protein RLZZ347_788 [Candidatus Parcubacteria bacterium]|jgi:hypothetical protein
MIVMTPRAREYAYLLVGGVFFFVLLAFIVPRAVSQTISRDSQMADEKPLPVEHLPMPQSVKGIYMTSFTAGNAKLLVPVLAILKTTEINSIVVDIKDYSGKISYAIDDKSIASLGVIEKRVPDMPALLHTLHSMGIYVIGRVAVFQDPFMVQKRPELAVKRASDKRMVWQDHKGVSWIDPGSREYWKYIVSIAQAAYATGFDEINFDYIRFPSDGNMNDIYYPESDGKVKAQVIKDFFAYLHKELSGTGLTISADIFGMTTTNTDDLNIGQILENALPYFDAVAPMVYPSHYPPGFNNYKNPAEKPYEVVRYSMDKAFARASTTPQKLRPWLQDFNLGATYTADMVRAQIKATTDAGFTSWLLWNPRSVYTKGALLPK